MLSLPPMDSPYFREANICSESGVFVCLFFILIASSHVVCQKPSLEPIEKGRMRKANQLACNHASYSITIHMGFEERLPLSPRKNNAPASIDTAGCIQLRFT